MAEGASMGGRNKLRPYELFFELVLSKSRAGEQSGFCFAEFWRFTEKYVEKDRENSALMYQNRFGVPLLSRRARRTRLRFCKPHRLLFISQED